MNSNSKLRVALFFGGVSSEHEVSCVSASAWLRALGQSCLLYTSDAADD